MGLGQNYCLLIRVPLVTKIRKKGFNLLRGIKIEHQSNRKGLCGLIKVRREAYEALTCNV